MLDFRVKKIPGVTVTFWRSVGTVTTFSDSVVNNPALSGWNGYQYYLLPPGGKTPKIIPELKVKGLGKLLGVESPMALAYLSAHKYDPVDETFLREMVRAMNQ